MGNLFSKRLILYLKGLLIKRVKYIVFKTQ